MTAQFRAWRSSGRRLQLNPLLVFPALWFGGLFWGIAAIVPATPSLAALKVIAEHSADGKPLVDFLSAKTAVAARLATGLDLDLPRDLDHPLRR